MNARDLELLEDILREDRCDRIRQDKAEEEGPLTYDDIKDEPPPQYPEGP
jgi:hypothetical protein